MPVPMMKCGHSANGFNGKHEPCCVICAGLTPDAEIVVEAPDLSKRRARCFHYGQTGTYHRGRGADCGWNAVPEGETIKPVNGICMCEVKSSMNLPFFEYKANKEFDEFYCGCWGWD
jgi:hypothetical protein